MFEYPAKSGQERVQAVADDEVVAVVRALMRRRAPEQTLLACYEGRAWREIRSADVNDYLHEVCGDDSSAEHLGIIPAVCRSAYIDPAVIEAFEQGRTIRLTLRRLGADEVPAGEEDRERVERAVLALLDDADGTG